jgi:predicted transcriptional regulator
MVKRGRLEIIADILRILNSSPTPMRTTPLLRKSNLSSSRFKEYFIEMIEKDFIKIVFISDEKRLILTPLGVKFLEKYNTIKNFIEEFDL